MTPIKRAEKIDGLYFDPAITSYEEKIKAITAQIEEAEREAVRKAIIGSFTKEYDAKYAEGLRAGQKEKLNQCKWCMLHDDNRLAKEDGHRCVHLQNAVQEGFNMAREKALEIYRHSGTSEEVEKRVGEMDP